MLENQLAEIRQLSHAPAAMMSAVLEILAVLVSQKFVRPGGIAVQAMARLKGFAAGARNKTPRRRQPRKSPATGRFACATMCSLILGRTHVQEPVRLTDANGATLAARLWQ
jgi:hypothetical protein